MKKYITLENLKQKNLSDILLYIMYKGKTSRREIQDGTGFSWGTVSTSVSLLIEKGYVKEISGDLVNTGVGRKSSFLCVNGDKIVGLGVDVNRTGVEAVIMGLDASEKYKETFPFNASTLEEVLALIEKIIDKLIAYCNDKFEIKSLGISFQGEIDGEKGISYAFPGIENWKEFNIKEYFFNKYSLPVYFEHDPKCMLYSLKSSNNAENVLLIRADDGIGLSVMQNGKIMEDKKKFEFGHTLVFVDKSFNNNNNLEYFSSASGISKQAGISFGEIKKNPDNYIEYFERATDYLSVAIYNLFVLFRPESIILTGELFATNIYDTLLKEKLKKYINDQSVEIITDLNLSAAKGVALNALKYNVKIKL